LGYWNGVDFFLGVRKRIELRVFKFEEKIAWRQRLLRALRFVLTLSLTASLFTFFQIQPAIAGAQIVSGEGFLQGQFAQVGIRANGAFGSSSVPAGFNANVGSCLGFRVDRSKDGWGVTTDDGDFFCPGSPYEEWTISVGGTSHFGNSNSTSNNVAGANSNAITTGTVHSVTWTSTSNVSGVAIQIINSLDQTGQTLNSDVTLTNVTASPIANVFFGRNVDPDNQTASGIYTSTNTVVGQGSSAFVKAEWTNGSLLGLRSTDSRARVARQSNSFSTVNPKTIWDAGEALTSSGTYLGNLSSTTADAGMYLAIKEPSLAANSSTTFRISYVLSLVESTVPSINTSAASNNASNIKSSTATLNGAVNANGISTATSFEYSVNANLSDTQTVSSTTLSSSQETAISANISGLLPFTRYYFRAKAVNSSGTTLGSIFSFITFPRISLQPTNDTTTAGLTDSFTVGTTTVAAPFSKTIKWQVATDTTTAVASVAWTDITSGSGSTNGSGFTTDTFTTATLTAAMNKFRYRAIVTFADTSTTFVETSTVVTLTVNPAITFTSSTSTISKKYGSSGEIRTVTYTGGTDTRTVSASATSLAGGKITFNTSTALFTIDTRTAVGTYLDTITITDAKGATASYVQTIVFTVADTLTVTSDTPTALTFTGSEAIFTPTVSAVSGLVSGDVISGATYNYSATATTCATGGTCSIGQTGPGGGLIFITPSTSGNTTGKFFEAAPEGWSGSATDPTAAFCSVASIHSGALGTAIGTGEANSNAISSDCIVSASDTVTALVLNGKDDWFMPSLDELKEMYNSLHKASPALGGFSFANYWSSSDDATTAGYALQGWFGSSDGITGWGITNETQAYRYRPVRSFTAGSGFNYGPTTTKPTNAGTYVVTPSVLTFSNGAASNYVAITYRTSTLTINKAAQAALVVTPLYNVFNGNPTSATLLTSGGSDTGTVTYAYVSLGSTSGGCALSGADSSTVTVTSAGTCRIVATKAATNNFLVAVSDTGTVTFYLYVTNIPAPRPAEYPAEIVLSGATAMTNTGLAPTITTTGNDFTASPGATFTIAGSGFVGTRLVRVSGTTAAFTVLSNTSLQVTMPTGLVGISGPIYVEKAEGSRVSEDWVTGTA
jgi:hypothetical protein